MTLDIITCDQLSPLTHGFFGRGGGASSGVFEGLNCGRGSSDQREAVALNRSRAAEAMNIDADYLVGVAQVHSAETVVVRTPDQAGQTADALVTDRPGLALSVLTADCAPVLCADTEAGVIGAAHAGWKGALGGVLEATIRGMEAIGAQRGRITAAIGPMISQRAYEVGPEFLDTFIAEDDRATRFFAAGTGDRLLFDLPGFVIWRLCEAGVADAAWTRHCTYSDPDRFFSYRRAAHRREADYGRLISAIRL